MKKTVLASHPDFYHQLIDSRFSKKESKSKDLKPITKDLYMDLLCVFHDPDRFNPEDFLAYPLSSILHYLRQTHQLYLTKSLQELSNSIEALAKADQKFEKLQGSLHLFFERFRTDLEQHIQEEERHLFPYIDALIAAQHNKRPGFDWKQKVELVHFLLHHDDSHEEDLKSLTVALNNTSSFNDSFAFRMLVNRLSIFELDLRIHAKLEEEVLMPLALELEKKVLDK